MRTDCAQTAHRLRTDCAQTAHRCAQTSVRILNARYTIPHRRSPQTSFIATTTGGRTSLNNCCAHLCAVGAHSVRVRTDVCGSFRLFFVCAQQCAQTALLTAAHRRRCACAQTAHRCAQQLCASSPTSVRIFTALMCNFVLIIPHRCSPTSVRMRTDCAQTAHRLRTDCAQMRTDVGAHPHRSIYNSSPTISYCAHRMRTECAPPFYSVRICAHSVRMRTTTIFCAQCAQPLRTDILCCAHSVRILCACSPTSVRSAQTLAVRILCALRTDVCGSFTPCLCAAHRLRTDAHRLSTLL